jgi:Fur family ferric uptake transcriptional regulator
VQAFSPLTKGQTGFYITKMDNAARLDKLTHYLTRNRLKNTHQRNTIVDVFFKQKQKHLRIEELLQVVRQVDAKIGYATVYRTLLLLVQAGLAEQSHFNDGQSRFEAVDDHHHDHIICTECGVIVEFENETIETIQNQTAKTLGFKLTGHKMELYGLCKKCQK